MTDEELVQAWWSGRVFSGGLTHRHHVRVAWVLHQRHGKEEARRRLLVGTERACRAHGCPEKFDPRLTERWSEAVAAAIEGGVPAKTSEEFLRVHPELSRRDLLGPPRTTRID